MIKLFNMDCMAAMKEMPDQSINCCVTSPPYYGLRDYGVDGQIGLEDTPEAYVAKLVDVFREVRRVLRDDGTLWMNLGDSYAGSGKGRNADGTHQGGGKQGTNKGTITGSLIKSHTPNLKTKDLIGIPWRVAFALQADGWYLRQDIIWHKPNPMPESVKDRCTKAHEYVFLMSKSARYYYDAEAVKEPCKNLWGTRDRKNGKYHNEGTGLQPHSGIEKEYLFANKRSVWTVNTNPYKEAHFATFPEKLVEPCIKAGCPVGGIVLDPFSGAGTVGVVADKLGRDFIGIELNSDYCAMSKKRINNVNPLFCDIEVIR